MFSCAVLWGLWKLKNYICFQDRRWKEVSTLLGMLVAEFSFLEVAEFLLSSREDDTRSWGNFLVYFSHKCHANLMGWGYIFIGC